MIAARKESYLVGEIQRRHESESEERTRSQVIIVTILVQFRSVHATHVVADLKVQRCFRGCSKMQDMACRMKTCGPR
jgi:hypothetical protein